MTKLPHKLPMLEILTCFGNRLTHLPKLPSSLKLLACTCAIITIQPSISVSDPFVDSATVVNISEQTECVNLLTNMYVVGGFINIVNIPSLIAMDKQIHYRRHLIKYVLIKLASQPGYI